MTNLLPACLLAYLGTAVVSLFLGQRPRWCGWLNVAGSSVAAVLGMIPAIKVLRSGTAVDFQIPWNLPMLSLHLRLDLLSAWFSLPVLSISALAAIYGAGYLRHHGSGHGVHVNWFFYQLLAGGMLFVLVAWDGMLFLIAWEIMSIAAWFLVMFEHTSPAVQRAGWIYLAATHLGTAFLFAMFVVMGSSAGSLDFTCIANAGVSANLVFLLAVIGFGSKAGFLGMHVWLPEAHPAAPSHVSGLMSGVMIKTGIYGLLRIMTLSDTWPEWWGWLLIGIGAASGVGGVLLALMQHDLKRLLAYHSVENIGIICLGIGIGVVGIQNGHPEAIVAIAGALLHVVNHAVFKTTLFMGAGSVLQATNTRDIDALGGLQKKLPVTAGTFLVAAAAICGLPPLNGFVSELLIYTASFKGATNATHPVVSMTVSAFVVVAALALIGGLAVMCFTKVYGIVFLGEPRKPGLPEAHEAPLPMRIPMLILAVLCVVLGLGGFKLVEILAPVAAIVHPRAVSAAGIQPLERVATVLRHISCFALIIIAISFLLCMLRRYLLHGRSVKREPTWGCGYAHGTPRMQYTGSSFVQPLLQAFQALLRPERKGRLPRGHLPEPAQFSSHTPDPCMKWVYVPVFSGVAAAFIRLRRIQHGRIHLYILYIILTLVGILAWSVI